MNGLKQWFALVTIVACLPMVTIAPFKGMAAPTQQPKGCLNFTGRHAENGWYMFMLLDRNDQTPNKNGPINIREKPTTRSEVVYVASSRNSIEVSSQVVGDDGYCWAKVRGTKFNAGGGSYTGWVRGDFVASWSD